MGKNYDIKDMNLAEQGRKRIDWAETEMPVLRRGGQFNARKKSRRSATMASGSSQAA